MDRVDTILAGWRVDDQSILAEGGGIVSWLNRIPSEPTAMDERRLDDWLRHGRGLPLPADPPPLRADEGGAIRVGASRISLDLVVEHYENGMAPEDMVRAYDTLELADVYGVIAYDLRHRDEVQAYLSRQEAEAESLRAKIESERPRISWDERLMRREAREKADAPTGQ